jgi:hypothetical protein
MGPDGVRLKIAIFCILTAFGCAKQSENKNFALSLETSASVSGDVQPSAGLRCDAATQLDCGRMNFVTGDGYEIEQEDSFASCVITPEGDLKVVVQATSDAQSSAQALFLVHRNSKPNGTARCEGLKPDASSATGFARSSCDVIVQFGGDIYAANSFDKCSAVLESEDIVKGSLSCSMLRSGKTKTLLVNSIGFYCRPTQLQAEPAQLQSEPAQLLVEPMQLADPDDLQSEHIAPQDIDSEVPPL